MPVALHVKLDCGWSSSWVRFADAKPVDAKNITRETVSNSFLFITLIIANPYTSGEILP